WARPSPSLSSPCAGPRRRPPRPPPRRSTCSPGTPRCWPSHSWPTATSD
ncbi:MAG: hypothetical protein AVDCRST_MAG35-581, partial [uncultured Quadrisphaera sp.]